MDLIGDEKTIREYLLGGLSEQDREQFEEQLFAESEFHEEVKAVEDALIQEYIAGRLSLPDRGRFEQRLLCTDDQRRQVTFARHLKRYRGQDQRFTNRIKGLLNVFEGDRRTVRVALGAVLILVAAGSVLLTIITPRGGPDATIAITLHPGQARGSGELQKLKVGKDVRAVRISLVLRDPSYSEYRASVSGSDRGNVVFTSDKLVPQGASNPPKVTLDLPVGDLAGGDYEIDLTGRSAEGERFEVIDSYYLRILR